MIEKLKIWFGANKVLALSLAALVALFAIKKFIKPNRRRTRRRTVTRGARRYLKRTRRQYTKGGKAKKPWQIKGSLAAKRHMARLRKMR